MHVPNSNQLPCDYSSQSHVSHSCQVLTNPLRILNNSGSFRGSESLHEMFCDSSFASDQKGLTLCSHNVNHILNKIDELKLFLECDHPQLDVYGLSETFLTDCIHDDLIRVYGYQTIRKDRKYGKGGGLIVYIKNQIHYKRRQDLEALADVTTTEVIWVELKLPNKSLLIAQVYRPPRPEQTFTRQWLNCLENSLQLAYSENKHIVVMGDVNIDLWKPHPLDTKWLEICSTFGLVQTITEPTRVTKFSESLIDHICISEDAKVLYHKVVKYSISDHFPVLVKLDMKNGLSTPKYIELKYRNLKKYNHESLSVDLENAVWPDCTNTNVNEATDQFTVMLTAIVNKHFPQISKRVKRVNQPGWINADILKCMKLRDGSKRRGKHMDYKFFRNLTTEMIREAKTAYYKDYVETNKHCPNKIANLFDELSGKRRDNSITSLRYNNQILTGDRAIADAFNSHFSNITKQLIPEGKNRGSLNFSCLQEYVASRVPPNSMFKIPLLTEAAVDRFLRNLDIKKASGLDGVDAKFLKLARPFITKILKDICNLSITSKIFPNSWKTAKVSPLYKKNSKDDPNNYRPISVLPILSKLLERHVADHLFEFLTSHDLLAVRQSGFRQKHSCETALHLMVDEWVGHMFQSEVIGVLYIDFCKAFDLVDHHLLLEKMKVYRFHNDSLDWFASYLSGRRQVVKINKTMSEQQSITQGVPQGSILGPLFFLLFVNDLPLQGSLEGLSLFADDATDSAHGTNVKSVECQLQVKLDSINNWCCANNMVIGIEKTKCMLMGSQQKLRTFKNLDSCLNVEVLGHNIEQVTDQKLLGVQIDNSLTWNEQVKKVKKTVLFKLSLLRKIRKYLPQTARITFFNYYIKPHLNYCCSIWGQTSQENLITINKLLKQAARLILDKDYSTPSAEMLHELQWQTFPESVHYHQALLVYKSLNNLAPPYMKDMFHYVKDISRPNLRSAANFKLYIPKTHHKSIRYSGPNIWNNLQPNVRTAESLSNFKRLYHTYQVVS